MTSTSSQRNSLSQSSSSSSSSTSPPPPVGWLLFVAIGFLMGKTTTTTTTTMTTTTTRIVESTYHNPNEKYYSNDMNHTHRYKYYDDDDDDDHDYHTTNNNHNGNNNEMIEFSQISFDSFMENTLLPLYIGLVFLYLLECYCFKWISYWKRYCKNIHVADGKQQQQQPPQQLLLQQEQEQQQQHEEEKLQMEKEGEKEQQQEKEIVPANEKKGDEDVLNLTGAYKLFSVDENYDDFLAVQGVPWTYRRMAKNARPIHRISHKRQKQPDRQGKKEEEAAEETPSELQSKLSSVSLPNESQHSNKDTNNGNNHTNRPSLLSQDQLSIRIEAGLFQSETSYTINGPPVQCNVRGRIFNDTVTYLPSGDGIEVYKRAVGDENNNSSNNLQDCDTYDVIVHRQLSKDKQTMTMTCHAKFQPNSPKKDIQSVQVFQRIE